jgi:hypothetical protein
LSAFLAPALLALAVLAFPAAAGDPSGGEPPPIKPATDDVKPASAGDHVKPASAGDSSRGGSAQQPTGPQDADLERSRAEDERRATESKEKMKTRPGYKENVPSPRA